MNLKNPAKRGKNWSEEKVGMAVGNGEHPALFQRETYRSPFQRTRRGRWRIKIALCHLPERCFNSEGIEGKATG